MTMAPLALFAVLTLTVLTGVRTQDPPHMFDCRRLAQNCNATMTTGACEDSSPYSCVCATGYKPPSAAITDICVEDSFTECTSGNLICVNGQCMETPSGEECFCDPMYTGITCDTSRLDLLCGGFSMTITVRPYEGNDFPGEIHTVGSPSCAFPAVANEETSLELFYNDPFDCGLNMTDGIYSLSLWILYNNRSIIENSDQILIFQCNMTNSSAIELPPFQLTANEGTDTGTIKSGPDLVEVTIVDVNTVVLSQPLTVGDKVYIRLSLTPSPVLGFLALGLRYVLLKPSPTSSEELYLVLGGCNVGEFDFITSGNLVIEVPFRVFMFFTSGMSTSSSLYINIGVVLCEVPADCAKKTDCSAKRRKRAADNEFEISRTLEVVYGGQRRNDQRVPSTSVEHADKLEDCFRKPEIQGIVSGLGLLALCFLLALIIAVYVAYRNNRRRDKSVYDDHSVTSSTQKLDMQIPRPRV